MKQILAALLICSLAFVSVGCEKKIRKAVDASARLAAQVNNLQRQVETSYDKGLISKETALAITVTIKDRLNPGVTAYTDFVANLSKKYPKGTAEKPTPSEWAIANALFQAVEAPLRDILVRVGALTAEQSAYISLAITALIELVDVIRGVFSTAQHAGGVRWQTSQI